MEVIRSPISNRDTKRGRPRFISVGGVEGLLVLGGSLAIAGFMALFTIKKSSQSRPRRPADNTNNIHEITKQTYIPVVDDDDGLMENIEFSSGKEGFQVVLNNHIDHELQGNGGPNSDLHEESISSQVSSLVSQGHVTEAAKQGKVEEKDECQHEILVLSDDSTPPESIVSCDEDYTESTDLSLDQEEEGHNKDQAYIEEEKEEEVVDQGDHLNDNNIESSEEDDSEEVTEHSSSLSSLVMEELTAPTYVKEFGDTDPNYESIAKEENSFNSLELRQKKFDVSGMYGSRTHLPPLSVGSNEMVSVASPTKAQLWLMLLPVVMLTLLLAMIHFFVVDNYVLDMVEF